MKKLYLWKIAKVLPHPHSFVWATSVKLWIGDKRSATLSSSFSISSVSYQSLCHRLTFVMIEVEDVSRFRKLPTLAKHKSFVGSYAMRLDTYVDLRRFHWLDESSRREKSYKAFICRHKKSINWLRDPKPLKPAKLVKQIQRLGVNSLNRSRRHRLGGWKSIESQMFCLPFSATHTRRRHPTHVFIPIYLCFHLDLGHNGFQSQIA